MKDPNVGAIFSAFAEAIHAKALVLKAHPLVPTQRARVSESISDDLKKLSNLLAPQVSRAALDEAHKLGIDLFTKTWHDQPGFDKKRKVFHLEHVCPISIVREQCCACDNAADVLDVLTTKLRVAWVLKAEDRRLTANGQRSNRPDPEAAYRDAGIDLVKPGDAV